MLMKYSRFFHLEQRYTLLTPGIRPLMPGVKGFTGLDWLQDHEEAMKSLETHCSSYLTCRN